MIYVFLLLISTTHLFAVDDDLAPNTIESKVDISESEESESESESEESESESEEPPLKRQKLEDSEGPENSDDATPMGIDVNEFIIHIIEALRQKNPRLEPLYSTAPNARYNYNDETEEKNLQMLLLCAFGNIGVSNAFRGKQQFPQTLQKLLFDSAYHTGLSGSLDSNKPVAVAYWNNRIKKYASALQPVLGLSIELSTENLSLNILIKVFKAFLNELAEDTNKFFYVENPEELKLKMNEYKLHLSRQPKPIEAIAQDFRALKIFQRQSPLNNHEEVKNPAAAGCNPNNLQGQKMPEDDDTDKEDDNFFQGNNPNAASSTHLKSTSSSTNSNDKYKTCASSRRSVFDPQLFNRLLNIEEEERIRVDPQADPSIQEEQRHQRFLQLVRQRTSHPGRVRFLFNLYDLRNQYPDLWQEVLDEENPPLEVRREDQLLALEMNRIVDFTKEQENYATFLEATGRFVYYYIGGEIVNRLAFILTTGLLIKTQEINNYSSHI